MKNVSIFTILSALMTLPVFGATVSRIDVNGNQRMDAESIRILADVKIGDNVGDARSNEIAKKLNISVAALSRYETGSFEPKSISLIVDLAFLYNVSTDYILGKTDCKNPEVDFDKLDIGLSSKTYETLTEKQKNQIKKIIAILVNEE